MKKIIFISIFLLLALVMGILNMPENRPLPSQSITPTGTTTTTTIPAKEISQVNKNLFINTSRLKVSEIMNRIPSVDKKNKDIISAVSQRDPSAQINDLEFDYEIMIRTVGEKRHNLDLFTSAFYSRIDIHDVPNNSKASALSDISTSIGVKYKYQISHHWEVEANGELQQNKMSQSVSNRRLNNTSVDTTRANLAVHYKPSDNFIGYIRFLKNDFLFLEPSGLDFNLSGKSLTGYGIGVHSLLPLDYLILTSSFGLDQYMSNYDGSIKVLSGQSFYGKIGAQFNLFGLPLFTEGFYRQSQFGIHYPSSTTTFEQKNQEIGLNLGITVNF